MAMTAQTCFTDEITVDGFCGGGGWSTGFELAIGRPVDIGINHDAAAIALHKKNHPYTRHYNAVESQRGGHAHIQGNAGRLYVFLPADEKSAGRRAKKRADG